ncbi:MAG: ABC transporter permease [Candidatus Omnitrophica bacterium]|nr:ABC transporter permease [Candidatus Omnitrophota bacterium]
MIRVLVDSGFRYVLWMGRAVCFLGEVAGYVFRGRIRWPQVLQQTYEQGVQSVSIIILTAFASGAVLALQGYVAMARFGAKEYISHLVGLSLVRELGPVFTALIFSGKAGARIAAELGTMNVNDQVLATRTMGVDPIEYLIVPRMVACFFALPVLALIAELVGITGGYFIGVLEAGIPGPFYISQTIKAIQYVDFFAGFIKVFFFAIIIGWICCYQGYSTSGGSMGVGKFTTKAVAFSYIFVILSNVMLTKIILTLWG